MLAGVDISVETPSFGIIQHFLTPAAGSSHLTSLVTEVMEAPACSLALSPGRRDGKYYLNAFYKL